MKAYNWFGNMSNAGNFVIGTPQKLKHKLEMVEALDEIEVATKLLKDNTGTQGDPLYSSYQRLHCELTPIGVDSREFDMIAKYLHNTHAKTHSSYTVDIVQIFRTSKEGEVERFRSTKGVGGTEPDFSEAQLLDDGVVVPLGKPKENTSRPKGSLLYNEYIVYNVEQIRMRYVVQVNFNFKI
ncbi:hypothetical protein ACFX13_008322 [Malus domestica]